MQIPAPSARSKCVVMGDDAAEVKNKKGDEYYYACYFDEATA